jgi:hypothetical protein
MRLRPCRGADADIAVYLRGGAVGEGGVVDVGEVLAETLGSDVGLEVTGLEVGV